MNVVSRASCCALHNTWLKNAVNRIRRHQRQATYLLQVRLCGSSRAGLLPGAGSCNKLATPTRLWDVLLICLPTR